MPPAHPAVPGRRFVLDTGGSEAVQLSFDDLGTPLSEVTFVVVDLETTGARSSGSAITEIGAVKVRGGQELGHFQTLVRPHEPIPPNIVSLTGITNAMVASAPTIEACFAAFMEFAGFDRGHVLVAHNAGFDVSFLKAAASQLDYRWPRPMVVDTLWLARRVVTKTEARNYKLATLAALFGARTSPTHRALDDARATVDVLHALLERVGPLGITHAEDLASITAPVPQRRRRKTHLADDLPTTPGVYRFEGPGGEVLYVGTATNIRRRVRSYFTSAETRKRIGEMVDLATRVRAEPCSGVLESRVRELRLIAAHDPPYNVRSKRPAAARFVVLTSEAYPRALITAKVPVDATEVWGPFPSTAMARKAVEALQRATSLRSCTPRLPTAQAANAHACLAKELGTCAAPCVDPAAAASYLESVELARTCLAGDLRGLREASLARIEALVAAERFEEAALERDRYAAARYGARRFDSLRPFLLCPELVAARPAGGGRWELMIARYGRLAGTVMLPRGAAVAPYLSATRAMADDVAPPTYLAERASIEETSLLADFCASDGARLGEFPLTAVPLAYPLTSALRPDVALSSLPSDVDGAANALDKEEWELSAPSAKEQP